MVFFYFTSEFFKIGLQPRNLQSYKLTVTENELRMNTDNILGYTGGPRITRFLGERKYRAMRNRVMRGPL